MKSEELVNSLKKTRLEISELEKRLKIIKDEEVKINHKLKVGIMFRPNEMMRIISYLMSIKTGNIYVPKIDYYAQDRSYLGYLIDDNGYKIKIYYIDASRREYLDENYLLSYQFLKDKYFVNINNFEINNFDDYQYIKEFIYFLAECQIDKEKHLTYDEMIEALSDFVKDKPKTKELNKK